MKKYFKMDALLVANFISTSFYSATYPYIHKEVMCVATDNFIALNQIITCIAIVFFGWLWNKKSEKLFKFFPTFCITETVLSISVAIFVTITNNIIAYYLLDTLIISIISRNIYSGVIKLRASRYNSEEKREHFDNNKNSVSAIATIIGSVIAVILELDFATMLWVAIIGGAIDNIIYLYVFIKQKS